PCLKFRSRRTLWVAEDVEAVFDQDPERVCILHGPVAVKGSIIKDEPWSNPSRTCSKVLQKYHGGDVSTIPSIDYLAPAPCPTRIPAGVKVTTTETEIVYQLGKSLPTNLAWLSCIGGSDLNWLGALIIFTSIASGIVFNSSTNLIDIRIFQERREVSVPLTLQFEYKLSMGSAPIHEVVAGRNTRIKAFYWKLWYGDDQSLLELDIHDTFTGPEVELNVEDIEKSCGIVGNVDESFKSVRNDKVSAPMDFAIVAGWQVYGDLLPYDQGRESVTGWRRLNFSTQVVSVVNSGLGKLIKVKGHVCRDGKPVIEVVSAFLYCGVFTDYENTFETTVESDYIVTLSNDAE
ncbi:hypothetical protein EV360DRAFT_77216, partial [Lentinula raphanica]